RLSGKGWKSDVIEMASQFVPQGVSDWTGETWAGYAYGTDFEKVDRKREQLESENQERAARDRRSMAKYQEGTEFALSAEERGREFDDQARMLQFGAGLDKAGLTYRDEIKSQMERYGGNLAERLGRMAPTLTQTPEGRAAFRANNERLFGIAEAGS